MPSHKSQMIKSHAARNKVGVVMNEFSHHHLHSGRSKKIVTNKKQAIAIALSVARKLKK
jgi:hypothetical protein